MNAGRSAPTISTDKRAMKTLPDVCTSVTKCKIRALFNISLACALSSLLGVFSLSAMTIVPRPGAESARTRMMLVAGLAGLAWFGLAYWARMRQRKSAPVLQWLDWILIGIGVIYLMAFVFVVLG